MGFLLAAAVAGVAVSAAGTAASYMQSSANAKSQQGAQDQSTANSIKDRWTAIDYSKELFANDLAYSYSSLDYQKTEFGRQEKVLDRNRTAIESNTMSAISGIVSRRLEDEMALVFQDLGIAQDAGIAAGKAAVQSSARNVEGNSVDAIINDVARQEGNAHAIVAMNRDIGARASTRNVIEARTAGTQQLLGQNAQTYAPVTQLRTMAPMAAINTPAPVATPSALGMIAGISGAVVGGFNTYNSLSGNKPAETFNQATSWLSSQFRI